MTLFRAALHASQKTGASALWCGSGMKGYVFLLFVKAQELDLLSSVCKWHIVLIKKKIRTAKELKSLQILYNFHCVLLKKVCISQLFNCIK